MQQKAEPVFSSRIVFVLELLRLFLYGIIISPLLLMDVQYFLMAAVPGLLVFFIAIRKFRFYENCFEICFVILRLRIVCPYNDLSKVIYSYGQYGGMPVVIFKPKKHNEWLYFIFTFFIFRFVLENKKRVNKLLAFMHKKGIEVTIDSDCKNKDEYTQY